MKTFKTAKGTEIQVMNLKGKDYMGVQQRLVWFREEKPLWTIETEFNVMTGEAAVAKAIIRDDTGRVIATAHKQETVKGFADHIEKAETGAIGRALLLCGYGTSFADSELDEGARLADAPTTPSGVPYLKPDAKPPAVSNGNGKGSSYTPTFGKYAGKSLSGIPSDELTNYISFLTKDPSKMSTAAVDFVKYAKIELESRKQNPQDSIPF